MFVGSCQGSYMRYLWDHINAPIDVYTNPSIGKIYGIIPMFLQEIFMGSYHHLDIYGITPIFLQENVYGIIAPPLSWGHLKFCCWKCVQGLVQLLPHLPALCGAKVCSAKCTGGVLPLTGCSEI